MDIRKVARRCIQGIKEYVPGKPVEEVRRELGLEDILKLASNENPLGPSPLALKAMLAELAENAHLYPEPTCPELVSRLAELHGLKPNMYVVNNGVDGVLSLLGAAFIEPGDEVVTSEYTFFVYQTVTARMDGVIKLVPMAPGWRIDVDGMIAAITPRTKLVFLCNPNNPTATLTTRSEFERLLAALPENALLISDEAYYEFVDDPEYPQTIPYLKDHPNLVITRTFSKCVGLAGVRVGYAIAHPEIIAALYKVRDAFPVNRGAQAGALASLDDHDFISRSIAVVQQGRRQLYQGMLELGLRPVESQTNFVLVDLGMDAAPVFDAMLREGVIVRPLGPQGLPHALRITVGTPEQNVRALAALSHALIKVKEGVH